MFIINPPPYTDLGTCLEYSDIERLAAQDNRLTSINVSQNVKLKELLLSVNELQELDIRNNTALRKLSINVNEIAELDISHNPALQSLIAQSNLLKSINIGNCMNLLTAYQDGTLETSASACKYTEGEFVLHVDLAVEILTHLHNSDGGKITQQATCTETGLMTYTCTGCGEELFTEVIPAKGHTVVTDSAVAATYTSSGKTEGSHCSVCGTVLAPQVSIPQLAKQVQTLTVKAKSPSVKASKVKKKAQTVAASKAVTVSKAIGAVTYKKIAGDKKITVGRNGKITLKKGLKKGTYKVVVEVSAAGDASHLAGSKRVTVKIKVK